ncbi:CALMF-like protein [Mya arenaria]|uniref:CALMF-like protein n=1 Tax=Mya arenaria TaxID=6604 RepID=A0ABY7FLM5_MYAAR|nr:CALMF-like protein [Mya arenaria]
MKTYPQYRGIPKNYPSTVKSRTQRVKTYPQYRGIPNNYPSTVKSITQRVKTYPQYRGIPNNYPSTVKSITQRVKTYSQYRGISNDYSSTVKSITQRVKTYSQYRGIPNNYPSTVKSITQRVKTYSQYRGIPNNYPSTVKSITQRVKTYSQYRGIPKNYPSTVKSITQRVKTYSQYRGIPNNYPSTVKSITLRVKTYPQYRGIPNNYPSTVKSITQRVKTYSQYRGIPKNYPSTVKSRTQRVKTYPQYRENENIPTVQRVSLQFNCQINDSEIENIPTVQRRQTLFTVKGAAHKLVKEVQTSSCSLVREALGATLEGTIRFLNSKLGRTGDKQLDDKSLELIDKGYPMGINLMYCDTFLPTISIFHTLLFFILKTMTHLSTIPHSKTRCCHGRQTSYHSHTSLYICWLFNEEKLWVAGPKVFNGRGGGKCTMQSKLPNRSPSGGFKNEALVCSTGREDVHFDEFLLMAAKLEACEDDEQELKEAFSVFDNGKGMVSVPDLRAIMANMGEKLSKEEVEEMIDEATILYRYFYVDKVANKNTCATISP